MSTGKHCLIQFIRHVLNRFFFSYLIQSILICTVTMSLIAAVVLLLSRKMKNQQSAAGRSLLWWIIGIGYLIPFKPHPAGTVATVVQNEARGISPVFLPLEQFVLLLVIWMIGAVICAVKTVHLQEQFTRSVFRLRKPADERTQMLASMLCEELGIAKIIPVFTMPVIETPMLTGILHPCILLPEQDYDDAELRLILKHELCHLRRGDLLCKLLWLGCRSIHWFNPLMPMLMRQMEQDCELACDEAVMENETADSANIYCKSILHTAKQRATRRNTEPLLATGFSGSKEMLRSRLQAILSGEKKSRCLVIAAAALMLTAMTGSILAYAASDRPDPNAGIPEQSGIYTTMTAYPAQTEPSVWESSALPQETLPVSPDEAALYATVPPPSLPDDGAHTHFTEPQPVP